jgi:hypothetical protein
MRGDLSDNANIALSPLVQRKAGGSWIPLLIWDMAAKW